MNNDSITNIPSAQTKQRPETFQLTLRKWANLNPAMEFRLFVLDKEVVGMSQRDTSAYYEFLKTDREGLEETMLNFFANIVRDRFDLVSYTVDVYVDRKSRVWIVDFNPFGNPTSALLFTWEELFERRNAGTTLEDMDLLRIVESQAQCVSMGREMDRAPIDVSMAPDFYRFMEIARKQNEEETSVVQGWIYIYLYIICLLASSAFFENVRPSPAHSFIFYFMEMVKLS